jgi:transposase
VNCSSIGAEVRWLGLFTYNVHLATFLRGECVQGFGIEGRIGLEEQVRVVLHCFEPLAPIHQGEIFLCSFACFIGSSPDVSLISYKPYPTDVSDEEWAFVAPYLALVREDAPQRAHDLREVFNALRWIVRAGASWRMLPHDFPPWEAVYQQTQRWINAGVFEAMVGDLRALLRLASGRRLDPRAAVLDSHTLRSLPWRAAPCNSEKGSEMLDYRTA